MEDERYPGLRCDVTEPDRRWIRCLGGPGRAESRSRQRKQQRERGAGPAVAAYSLLIHRSNFPRSRANELFRISTDRARAALAFSWFPSRRCAWNRE